MNSPYIFHTSLSTCVRVQSYCTYKMEKDWRCKRNEEEQRERRRMEEKGERVEGQKKGKERQKGTENVKNAGEGREMRGLSLIAQ